jgi:AcrR family transcriptional regulator
MLILASPGSSAFEGHVSCTVGRDPRRRSIEYIRSVARTTRSRVGRPPGADADRTRTTILDAALAAFADRGFDGASIREITGAAGVGHNLVRHYFGSKEDLWRATVHHALDAGAARLSEVLRAADGRSAQAVSDGVDVVMAVIDDNPLAVRLLVSEALRDGPRFDEIFDEVLAPLGDVILEYFGGPRDGARSFDPRVLSLFVFVAVYGTPSFEGLVRRLGLADSDGRLHDFASEGLRDLVLGGLLGAAQPR